MNDKINLSINISAAPATIQGKGRTRTNLSVPHLFSACHFSRQLKQIEDKNKNTELGSFWDDILANATASLLLTVAALESYSNELFADYEQNFSLVEKDVFLKLWEVYEQKPLLDKFDLALLLRKSGRLDRGQTPIQDIVLIIKLRNALVHFKPEWIDEQEEHTKLSHQLSSRFTPSPFFENGESIFPRAWATHDCTSWAIRSSIAFIEGFEKQSKLKSKLEIFRSRLVFE